MTSRVWVQETILCEARNVNSCWKHCGDKGEPYLSRFKAENYLMIVSEVASYQQNIAVPAHSASNMRNLVRYTREI